MTNDWPFEPLQPFKYGVILADPPWRFRTWGEHNQHKAASKHYSLMTTADIKALPVNHLAAPHCVLALWCVQPMVDQAIDVMRAWGFKYKTMGTWAKQSSTGLRWAFGTGYLFRCAAEFYVIGTIGDPSPAVRNVRNLIVSPVREHSRKPEDLHVNLERMFPDAWRCELFAREKRTGWDSWGHETGKFEAAA